MSKIGKILNLMSNMGPRYVSFRAQHEVMRRSGLLKKKFPTNPPYVQHLTLQDWKALPVNFFFDGKESLNIPVDANADLKERYDNYCQGKFLMFNSFLADLGTNYDWITNPDSGYKYDVNKHWTEIPDYSKEAGDIKYVWEKSRFSYLYDIIRYDYHFKVDCAQLVFADILSWIKHNPVNCGPNYRCSQEMSLRVLNWTFALYYYKNNPALTEDIFNQMQHVIYWHLHHIYNNINFSRIAVRNNHAITETLTLYLGGMLYPTFPNAATWKKKGEEWFTQEVAYQVYEDGTFLQYSMNYHRIVAQLLTWAITLADLNKEKLSEVIYKRAKSSFIFLRTCMVDANGYLPNYGANDGALFFRFTNSHYRDYRSQLQALGAAIGCEALFNEHCEEAHWYGIYSNARKIWTPQEGIHEFRLGGYYIIREPETLTFIKCGGYKDRPSQADNLHLDIWYQGENILPDAGSYKYNTDDATIRYFSGTASHNTVMINNSDQMLKGGRFIWYYWTQCIDAQIAENTDTFTFSGTISAFAHLGSGITHTRNITKQKGTAHWIIADHIDGIPAGATMQQLWHINDAYAPHVTIIANNQQGQTIAPLQQKGWASSLYGQKSPTLEHIFQSNTPHITTNIHLK